MKKRTRQRSGRQRFVGSLGELAVAVGRPQRSIERYHARREENGFPGATPQGRYNVERTQSWLEEFELRKAERERARRVGARREVAGVDPEQGLLEGIRPEDLEGGIEAEIDDKLYVGMEQEIRHHYTRRVLQLRHRRERGQLLERAEVEKAQRAAGRLVQFRLLETIKPLARLVAGRPVREVESVLEQEMRKLLRELATELASLREGVVG